MIFRSWTWAVALVTVVAVARGDDDTDRMRVLQTQAIEKKSATWGYWGPSPATYSGWTSHTNRLTPIYVFGGNLSENCGSNSLFRDAGRVESLLGADSRRSVNPDADYCDQTDIFRLQRAAYIEGKRYIILVVFDGMDWQTTAAASAYQSGSVGYQSGRGSGLVFQDYAGASTDYGFMVTTPYAAGADVDVNAQRVIRMKDPRGGYDAADGGSTPWSWPPQPLYLMGKYAENRNAYTDSASSASSMTSGIKTFNGGINVTTTGARSETLAHEMQSDGYAVGVVTSVPVSHATPAAAYAHNVSRNDYQDITRDMLGLRSSNHPRAPLPGLDVLIGCGWGEERESDGGQGDNFQPGNRYITQADLLEIDVQYGGKYVVAQRTQGANGAEVLQAAVDRSLKGDDRLFGFFGVRGGHLPFQTADGAFNPTLGANPAETYAEADIAENPTLAQMTQNALQLLERNEKGFYLMVEAGDVDWANHDNNLDNSIGAVLSGDDAVRAIFNWVEQRDGWDDTIVVVTADHGHYLNLVEPEVIAEAAEK